MLVPDAGPTASSRTPLVVLLLVALVLRVGWAWTRPTERASLANLPDQREYVELADSIRTSGDKPMHFFDERFGQDVYAYRTPGYPIFLAVAGASLRAARVVQAFVDTSTVLAVYVLARRWLSERHALVAAGLIAVNPFLVYFSGLLLSESLFTSLLVWGVAGLAHAGGRAWASVAGVACLAVATTVRPSALPLVILMSAIAPGVVPVARARTALAGICLLGFLLGPWAARNQNILGRAVLTTTNGGITLYDGFNPTATGASDQSFVAQMPELREMDEVQRSDYLEDLGWRFIRERPADAVLLGVKKLARTWSPVPLSAEFGQPAYRLVALAYAVPFYALVLLGLVRSDLSRGAMLFLFGPAIYFSVVHVMSVGSLRYRIPVEPILAVIAASSVVTQRMKSEADG
jgi:4-amino-4-deoxy-L-arabinose transferase-like glycosyltransferase